MTFISHAAARKTLGSQINRYVTPGNVTLRQKLVWWFCDNRFHMKELAFKAILLQDYSDYFSRK